MENKVNSNATTDYSVSFTNDGKLIGKLDFNGQSLRFEGPEPEESARIFMEYLSEHFASRLAPPDGWILVPVSATDEMLTSGIEAAIPAVWIDSISEQAKMNLSARYNAMLRAAPSVKGDKS